MITVPRELRERHNIEEGDTLSLTDLESGVVVMSLRHSRVDEITSKLGKEWMDSGETLESMLTSLQKIRAKHDTRKP